MMNSNIDSVFISHHKVTVVLFVFSLATWLTRPSGVKSAVTKQSVTSVAFQ